MMSTDSLSHPPRGYWNAQNLTINVSAQFLEASHNHDKEEMLTAYFVATHYYARTLTILPEAFADRNDRLVGAVLRNLLLLDSVLGAMHIEAPQVIPLAMPVTEAMHDRYVLGLIVSVFEESATHLSPEAVVERVNGLKLLGSLEVVDVTAHLANLVRRGMLSRTEDGYRRTGGLYLDLSMAQAILGTLLGPDIAPRFFALGFERFDHITARPTAFMDAFVSITGLSENNAALFVNLAFELQDVYGMAQRHWKFRDLIHSGTPRPYQLEAYAVFRGYGYNGVLVEAPTGSGKTMMGLMCIQDWLGSLVPGQSILVLVPTNNYQQQWVRELCYNPLGLDLTPEVVFAGSPRELVRATARTGELPAVIVMTYAGLAQSVRRGDLGGSDAISDILASYGVREIILDEVHKVADDLESVTSEVVRRLVGALHRDEISGLIGFTGTGEAFRERFEVLGLRLVFSIPMIDLVAAGFVAPYAEFGLSSAYSGRERAIRDLLEQYKDIIRRFIGLAGATSIIDLFKGVDQTQREAIALRLLNMYGGSEQARDAVRARLEQWGFATDIGLAGLQLVSIVQAALGQTDFDLVSPPAKDALARLLVEAETVRKGLTELMFVPDVVETLRVPGLGTKLDVAQLERAMREPVKARRLRDAKLALASTLAGSYEALRSWYQYMGEGRVATIKATVEAERAARTVTGVIVFDRGKRIRWESGIATPGFDGVAGLFAEILGDSNLIPIAALGSEIYLPDGGTDDLINGVSTYIEHSLMKREVGAAMADLLVADLGLSDYAVRRFHSEWDKAIDAYLDIVKKGATRGGHLFSINVLRRVRREFGHQRSGIGKEEAARLRRRLNLRNNNLRSLFTTFADYESLADRWSHARTAQLRQASGLVRSFKVIRMPAGRRKQLMYDLVSRLVDAPEVPFNMVIVSQWARTGWNVLRPNVLIDATATRDITAWQQLRGRAMRALPTWMNDCYYAQASMLDLDDEDEAWAAQHPPDVLSSHRAIASQRNKDEDVGGGPIKKLLSVLEPAEKAQLQTQGPGAFHPASRISVAVRLMRKYNKVTHIYELLKATGSEVHMTLDRASGRWIRKDALARKHDHELAPALDALAIVEGSAHAPIIYARDPRTDSPTEVTVAIRSAIDGKDPMIIETWLRATSQH